MEIVEIVKEYNQVEIAMNVLRTQINALRKVKSNLEGKIIEYITENERDGIKTGGKTLKIDTANRRSRKGKKAVYEGIHGVLDSYGINNSDRIITEIIDAYRGEIIQKRILKSKSKAR